MHVSKIPLFIPSSGHSPAIGITTCIKGYNVFCIESWVKLTICKLYDIQ